MLQQTRVASVIPYFERFMARYPDALALADAPLDQVLQLWSGLGYYARARNLHRAAGVVRERHAGALPSDFSALRHLPGIGRSTAGAILALACGQRYPILDGNVKRVLARFHGVDGWPGRSDVQRCLWGLAEEHTPRQRVAEYTQAMMDLGAMLCTSTNPACSICPVRGACVARRTGRTGDLPAPKPRVELAVRETCMLMLCTRDNAVLLERRPPVGVWGGLWSFPECPVDANIPRWCRERLCCEVASPSRWPTLRHTFSHFRLDITPVHLHVERADWSVRDAGTMIWHDAPAPPPGGLPAPVQRLLSALVDEAGC
jgi:A/G-specific adenine glycosylase